MGHEVSQKGNSEIEEAKHATKRRVLIAARAIVKSRSVSNAAEYNRLSTTVKILARQK